MSNEVEKWKGMRDRFRTYHGECDCGSCTAVSIALAAAEWRLEAFVDYYDMLDKILAGEGPSPDKRPPALSRS